MENNFRKVIQKMQTVGKILNKQFNLNHVFGVVRRKREREKEVFQPLGVSLALHT